MFFVVDRLRPWHQADLGVFQLQLSDGQLNVPKIGLELDTSLRHPDDLVEYPYLTGLALLETQHLNL